jgi:hypothetical protein
VPASWWTRRWTPRTCAAWTRRICPGCRGAWL